MKEPLLSSCFFSIGNPGIGFLVRVTPQLVHVSKVKNVNGRLRDKPDGCTHKNCSEVSGGTVGRSSLSIISSCVDCSVRNSHTELLFLLCSFFRFWNFIFIFGNGDYPLCQQMDSRKYNVVLRQIKVTNPSVLEK